VDEARRRYGSHTLPGGREVKSLLFVPLTAGGRVRGLINLNNPHREHAFSDADVRLLQTLAASMSVALENARLFDETQRLYKESEQRAAELAIINSVQQALAAELNMQGIYDAVGNKIREIFGNRDVAIRIFDNAGKRMHFPFLYEAGERITLEPRPLNDQGISGHVARTRQTLVINENLYEEAAKYGSYTLPGTNPEKAAVYVPLISGDQVRGMIDLVDMEHENAFTDSDVRLLQTLAGSMSVALENARLFDETQRLLNETEQRNAELAIINSVQQGLASKLEIDAIYKLVGDKMREIFRADTTYIAYHLPATHEMVFPYYIDQGATPGQLTQVDRRRPYAAGLTETIIETGVPILAGTLDEQSEFGATIVVSPGSDRDLNESYLGVPILSEGRPYGVVSVQSYRKNAYAEADLRLLGTLASTLSVALENARLFDETQRLFKESEQRAAELAIINSVQQALAAELNIQGIYDAVGHKIREIFSQADVGIRIFDTHAKLVHFPFTYEGGKRAEIEPLPLRETGFSAHVLKTRETLVINEDMDGAEARYGSFTVPGTFAEKSAVYVPLISGDQVRGLISIADMERENAFTDSHVRLLQTLASSMSVALENARLFDETQRLFKESEQRAAELAIITSVQQALAAELNIQGIYDAVGDKIREIFNRSDLSIRVFDAAARRVHFPYLYEGGERVMLEPAAMQDRGFEAHVFKTGETLVINEGMQDVMARMGSEHVPGTQMDRSAIFVPLSVGSEVRGLLSLSDMEKEHAFSDSDVRLLQTLAGSMSVALENARLFDETQRLYKESEQRAAELAIINSVQRALAAELNMQGIYDAVGDKIREIFRDADVSIRLHDPRTGLVHVPFIYEEDRRVHADPKPLVGFTRRVVETREPLIINENVADEMKRAGSVVFPGTKAPKSLVFVPLFSGDQVRGVISLQNVKRENAFGESDLRLLQTLANTMSVALENARLFDETQRLYKESEQRAAELAIINSVQEALSSKLALNEIYEAVGDKLREVFPRTW
jgi:GAF domain-containing protein